jgi:hypothetical protein
VNFQQFNERFGPIQNLFGTTLGHSNLWFIPGRQEMSMVQTAPAGYVWTALLVDGKRMLVNGNITAGNRIGHMVCTIPYDHDEHFEVELADDFPEAS